MEFKNKTFHASSEDIFLNDKLGRKDNVENITRLLCNVTSPLVLSVNAPWGAGKTSFLKMLSASLSVVGSKAVYFSAWETDFADDPLLAFLGEMNLAIAPYLDGDKKKIKAWNNVKKAGAHILKRSVPVALKVATVGLIDADKLIEDESAKLAETLSKDLIDKYVEDKALITKFKDSVKSLTKTDAGVENLYVFVDELDRCRPTYAIELLERIKHLLDVEGLVFILALDKVQLAHSVKAVYGNEFDASGYLKRFIDIEYSLPSAPIGLFVDYLYDHFGFAEYFNERDKSHHTRGDGAALKKALAFFPVSSGMSLRTTEQLFARLNLILLMVKPNQYLYPLFLVFLLVAKEMYSNEYLDFIGEKSDGSPMTELLYRLMPGMSHELLYMRIDIESMIIASKFESNKTWFDKRMRDIKDTAEGMGNDPKIRTYYGDVWRTANEYSRSGFPVQKILSRIDMLDSFLFEQQA